MKYIKRDKKELKEIARKIVANEIFPSWAIRKNDERLLGSIFMPLMFLKDEDVKEMKDAEITFFFEEYCKSMPRSINGYPMFMSFNALSKDEGKLVINYCKVIDNAIKNTLIKGEADCSDTSLGEKNNL